MAGTPSEDPTQFVYIGCHNILAGIPTGEGPPYKHYDEPPECGACGSEKLSRSLSSIATGNSIAEYRRRHLAKKSFNCNGRTTATVSVNTGTRRECLMVNAIIQCRTNRPIAGGHTCKSLYRYL